MKWMGERVNIIVLFSTEFCRRCLSRYRVSKRNSTICHLDFFRATAIRSAPPPPRISVGGSISHSIIYLLARSIHLCIFHQKKSIDRSICRAASIRSTTLADYQYSYTRSWLSVSTEGKRRMLDCIWFFVRLIVSTHARDLRRH